MSVLRPVSCGYDDCSFVLSFEITKRNSSVFALFQDCFDYVGSLGIPYKFEDGSISAKKNIAGILGLNLKIVWGSFFFFFNFF